MQSVTNAISSEGKTSPQTLGHVSSLLPNMKALRQALAHLKKPKVEIEDPGYRWELHVPGGRE